MAWKILTTSSILIPKLFVVWDAIKERTHIQSAFFYNISIGFLLENISYDKNFWVASLITTASWFIWKSKCNLIFKCTPWDLNWIAIDHMGDFNKFACYQREIFFLNHFNSISTNCYFFFWWFWVNSDLIGGLVLLLLILIIESLLLSPLKLKLNLLLKLSFEL